MLGAAPIKDNILSSRTPTALNRVAEETHKVGNLFEISKKCFRMHKGGDLPQSGVVRVRQLKPIPFTETSALGFFIFGRVISVQMGLSFVQVDGNKLLSVLLSPLWLSPYSFYHDARDLKGSTEKARHKNGLEGRSDTVIGDPGFKVAHDVAEHFTEKVGLASPVGSMPS